MRRKVFIVFLVAIIFFGGGVFAVVEAVDAPSAFTATAASSCAILLEWEDMNPVDTTYDIKRDGITVLGEVTRGTGDLYFIDKHDGSPWGVPIDPGDTYAYSVRAQNPNTTPAQSGWVGPGSATTFLLPSQPGQPINITSTVDDSTGNIEISWATSPPISEYFDAYGGSEVWLATGDGSIYTSFSQIGRVPGDPSRVLSGKFFYETPSNDKDVSYQYKLRVQEVGGLGCDYTRSQHVVLSVDSDVLTIPRRPDNLSAQFLSEQSKIVFTWNDNQSNPNETEFEIHRATDLGFGSYLVLSAGTDSFEYNDTDIIQNPPTPYYYRIRSCIDDTCSFWSDTTVVTTGLPVIADLGLRISYATAVGATTTLTWTPEVDIIIGSELRIERATSSLEFQEIAQLGTGAPQRFTGVYLDEQLLLGETYVYRTRVCDGAGAGAICSTYSPSQPSANLDLLFILKGVAWSAVVSTPGQVNPTGVGWIKLNSVADGGQATDSSIPYSVQADKAGLVTGMAWADVILGDRASYGWISFYPDDLVGCPSGTCEARLDPVTGAMSGWARFIAPESFTAGDSSWDGWISLSGTTQTVSLDSPFGTLASLFEVSPFIEKPFSVFASLFDFATAYAQTPYGVQVNFAACVGKECPIFGQAWGGDVIGWIGFNTDTCTNCTARVEVINEAPSVSNVQIVAGGDWCVETPFYSVQWDFNDPDGDLHESAEVALVEANITDFDGTGATMLSVVSTPGSTYTLFTERFSDPLGYIATGNYNQTNYLATETSYKPWVRAFDGFSWSDWVVGSVAVTPAYYWPDVSFTYDQPQGIGVNFTDGTVERSGGVASLENWSWIFGNGAPSDSSEQNPQGVVFNKTPATVTLTVTDSNDETCLYSEDIETGAIDTIPTKRRIFRER